MGTRFRPVVTICGEEGNGTGDGYTETELIPECLIISTHLNRGKCSFCNKAEWCVMVLLYYSL